ncbi:hypothetical protein K2Q00_01530 [Patescibacteria group bacterium]|nr:hypothetical protein [Patescibacteria group bacterium]
MNKKFVYIILIALAIFLLVALLWWWFLRREGSAIQNTGTFGTAQNAAQNKGSSNGTSTNVGTPLSGPDVSMDVGQTNTPLGGIGQNTVNGQIPTQDGGATTVGPITVGNPVIVGTVGVPDVVWLSGDPASTTQGGTTNGAGTVFNPTAINQIAQSNPTGNGGILPNIGYNGYGQQTNNSGSALGSIGIAAGVGVVSCAIVPALQEVASKLFGAKEAAPQATAQASVTAGQTGVAALSVSTIDLGANTRLGLGFTGLTASIAGNQQGQQTIDQFMGCITRNVAKIMLQQITSSVVNWINSGFNGSPAFVQNPTQFIQKTTDVIAGQYIQSSALSFLCSPFQLQVKIAIAQSYANRNAASCTLTQVSNNITGFMRGSFSSAGGWPAFLSFTSVPTNNPYGAFMYASAGLLTAQNKAQNQVRTDLLQGSGFLSFQQKVAGSCVTTSTPPPPSLNKSITAKTSSTPNSSQQLYEVCDYVTATPGKVIADSLGATQKSTLDQLTLAKSFDEIISALINQLMTRTLQSGLSNLSGQNGYASNFYTVDQQQAQGAQQTLLAQMQSDTATASQYGSVQQGSIQDIQSAQNQLNNAYNCWNNVAQTSTSTTITASVKTQALTNAASASTTLGSLNTTVDSYNDRITKVNVAIVALQQLESRVLSASSGSEVSAIQNDYNAAKASGQFPTAADVTNAQQNRVTLQSQMSTISSQANDSLQQCNAIF